MHTPSFKQFLFESRGDFDEPELIDLSTARFILHACKKVREVNAILIRCINMRELQQKNTFLRPVSSICTGIEIDDNSVRIPRVTNLWLNAIQKLQMYLNTMARNGYSSTVGTTQVVTTAYEDFCDMDPFITHTYTTVDPLADIRTTMSLQILQTYDEHAAYLTKMCNVIRKFSEQQLSKEGNGL